MAETSMHAGPRMQQLLAEAEPGTTPEQIAFRLSQTVLHSIYALAAIVAGMIEAEHDDARTDTLLGLESVLKNARRDALDLDEVLQDADRSERPLKLRLEPEASHG